MRVFLYLLLVMVGACQVPGDHAAHQDLRTASVDTSMAPGVLASGASVRQFYQLRDNKVFWLEEKGPGPLTDSLLYMIENAAWAGLNPDDYHIPRLRSLLRDSLNAHRYIEADLLLTDAWLTLYAHLKTGRLDPQSLKRRDEGPADHEAINKLVQADRYSVLPILRQREPADDRYRALKRHLAEALRHPEGSDVQHRRAVTIALNMERLRWQSPLPDRYISVNIPAFLLRVMEDDSVVLETRVIVGKRETPTPVMQSVIRSFIIYPYWHVPKSIATREILPALVANRDYLRRNNFDVLDRDGQVILSDTIQWEYYTPDFFPFILRQREGSENSMGIIKFAFANRYGVYLHDTNSKRLFSRERRDLSHGCVRVSDAVALAHYLVRDDDIYVSPEDLDQYLSLQQRLTINVRKPIVVRLEYYTAESKDGRLLMYDDIYRKDSVMAEHLGLSRMFALSPPL